MPVFKKADLHSSSVYSLNAELSLNAGLEAA